MAPLARTALLVGVGVAGASYLAPAGPSRPLRAPPSCGAQNIVCAAALDASWRLPAVLEAKAAHNPLADLSQDHQWMLYRSTRYLREHEELIQRALAVAATAHSGQKRRSGEDFIMHPIETAVILAEVRPVPALRARARRARTCARLPPARRARRSGSPGGFPPRNFPRLRAHRRLSPSRAQLKMDADTIVAGLLHDTVEDTELTLDDISFHFGPEVMEIVRGDSKMSKLCGEAAALPADERKELNHRNMLLAMGDDWRIVVVKLADRLHNMRTLEHMPRHKQVAIARETLQIFVPLARRLGIETLERELTDISVEYIFPEELKGVFGLELLGHWARIRFWGALDGLLLRDTVLSELDVDSKLDDHRERWAEHADYWAVAFSK